jgi:hypothetical protein
LIVGSNKVYLRGRFESEDEIKKVFESSYRKIFGEEFIYIPVEKPLRTAEGRYTAPDGFLVDLQGRRWFIVEVELYSHGVWSHIIPQITRHLVAAMNPEEREKLVGLFADYLESVGKLESPQPGAGSTSSPRGILEEVVREKPGLVVVIDRIPGDLNAWKDLVTTNVILVEVTKYVSEDGEALYSIPDYLVGLAGIPAGEYEESGEKQVMSREDFLAKCIEPICTLYKKLESLAEKHEGKLALEPRQQSMSLRLRVPPRDYKALFTIYTNSIYMIKDNIDIFTKHYGPEKVANLLKALESIRAFKQAIDTMNIPGVRAEYLTQEDIETIVSAIEELLEESKPQKEQT